MGIHLNGIEIGAACFCHPEPVNTPETLYVLLSGVGKCPGHLQVPNGLTWVCHQHATSVCRWDSAGNGSGMIMRVDFICALNSVAIQLTIPGTSNFFLSVRDTPIDEYDPFPNVYGGCAPGQHGFGGIAVPFWLSTVSDLVTALDLPTDGSGLFLESFQVSADEIVHRFANVTYGLNKKVKISV